MQSCSSHRRGSLAAVRCCCCTSPHGHDSVSEYDSVKHPAEHSPLVLPLPLPLWVTARGEPCVRPILGSLLDGHTEGRDSRSPLSSASSFTRSLRKLASPPFPPSLCLHFPPLFPSPLPLLLQLQRPRTANGREGAAERGGWKARDWLSGAHVTPGREPSTSCPAHASLQTSVAIDNSCFCSSPTTDPQTQNHWLAGFMASASYCGGSALGHVVQSVVRIRESV